MKRFVLLITSIILILPLFSCSKSANKESASSPMTVAEGKAAADFTLENLSGKKVSLKDYAGKVVLVNFWATWCPPCREEIPSMVKLNSIMAGKPFQMLCISIDEGGKKDIEAFLNEQKIILPVLMNPDQSVAKQYGITGVPETFIVDTKGIVVKKVVGGMDWSSSEVVDFLTKLMK